MKRTMRALVAVVFVALVGGGLTLSTQPAQAWGPDSCSFLPDETGNQAAVVPGPSSLAATMVTPTGSIDPSTLTVFELLQGQGQSWTTYGKTVKGDAGCNVMDQMQTAMATIVLNVNDSLAGTAILVSVVATDNDGLLGALFDKSKASVDALDTKFFRPLSVAMFIILGMWIAWVSTTQRANIRELLSKVGAALAIVVVVATCIAGGWYINIVTSLDKVTAETQSTVTGAMLAGATDDGDPCSVPDGAVDQGRRQMTCQMWYSMSFLPWSIGQYGSTGVEPIPYTGPDYTDGKSPHDFRVQQLWNQTYSLVEYASVEHVALMPDGSMVDTKIVEQKADQWEALAEHARKAANGDDGSSAEQATWQVTYGTWRGQGSGTRFTTAFNGLGGTLISSIATVWLSILNLGYQILPVLLFLALPIVALIAMMPKTNFLFKEWGFLLGKSFLMRIVTGVALALVLMLMQIILEMRMAPALTGIYQLVVAIGLIMLFRMVTRNAMPQTQTESETKNAASDTASKTTNVVTTVARKGSGTGGGKMGLAIAAGTAAASRNPRRKSSAAAEEAGRRAAQERAGGLDESDATTAAAPRSRPGAGVGAGASRRVARSFGQAADALTDAAREVGQAATAAAQSAESAAATAEGARSHTPPPHNPPPPVRRTVIHVKPPEEIITHYPERKP